MHAGSVLFLGAAESAGGLGGMFCGLAGMPGIYVRSDSDIDLPRTP